MANLGVTVEIFENGSNAGSDYMVGFYVPGTKFDASGVIEIDRPSQAQVQALSGGSATFTTSDPWQGEGDNSFLTVQTPGRDPLSVIVEGGFPTGHQVGAIRPFFVSRVFPSPPNGISVHAGDLVRLWFVQVSLRLRQLDDSHLLRERWVGGGGEEWSGEYAESVGAFGGAHPPLMRDQTWFVPGLADGSDSSFNVFPTVGEAGYLLHGYTGADGVCATRFLAAWAVRHAGDWTLYTPSQIRAPDGSVTDTAPTPGVDPQNVALYVDHRGRHPRKPWYVDGPIRDPLNSSYLGTPNGAYPWALKADVQAYRYDQAELGAAIDETSWDGSGHFTTPAPGTVTHTYHQGIHLTLKAPDGTPVVGATVSFGAYSGVTDAGGEATVEGVPRGSTLAGITPWLANSPSDVTSVPLADASAFTGESEAKIKPSTYGGWHPTGGESADPYGILSAEGDPFPLHPVGTATFSVSGNTLLAGLPVSDASFDGGEVLALPCTVTVEKDGTTTTTEAYVWEDEFTEVLLPDFGTEPSDGRDGSDLDWRQDPVGEPYLSEATLPGVRQYEGVEMEKRFTKRSPIIEIDRVTSPSGVVLRDHRHMLSYVQNGQVLLVRSDDNAIYDSLPLITLADDRTYVGVCLRRDADDSLHARLTDDGGALYHSESADGGETWDGTPALIDSLPSSALVAGKAQRIDVRHDGERHYALIATDDGLRLYSARNTLDWTHESDVAESGDNPLLLVAPDGSLLALCSDGGSITCRNGTDDGSVGDDGAGSWTWDDPVEICSGLDDRTPFSGFVNAQKILVSVRKSWDTITHYRSRDLGATWEAASEG